MSTVITARRLVWLVPAIGLLAACSEKKPAQAVQTPSAAAESAATAAPAPPPPVTASLTEKNRSGITGTVTLTRKGDSTEVALTLNGARPGKYPSHIHGGTCAKPGPVVAPLQDVTVGKDKTGTSTTMVLTSVLDSGRTKYSSLIEQSHLVRGMRPVACAEIPAQ